MQKSAISENNAKKELNDILDYYSCAKLTVDYQQLLYLLMSGKLSWNREQNSFTLQLFSEVKNQEGTTIKQINLSMLKGQDLIDAHKNDKNDMETAIFYVSASSGLPFGSCSSMFTKDLKNAQAVIGLFL